MFPLSVTRSNYNPILTKTSMGNDSYSNNCCASGHEFWVLWHDMPLDIMSNFIYLAYLLVFFLNDHLHFYTSSWKGTFFMHSAVHECCSHVPLSAILIGDKNQSSTPENSISLMRYEYSSKRKSEIVCCFQTNPLKVIWSSAANYSAFWAASLLYQTPPPPFPTPTLRPLPSVFATSHPYVSGAHLVSLRYYWGAGSWQADIAAQSCEGFVS